MMWAVWEKCDSFLFCSFEIDYDTRGNRKITK
jgi:hypothetical protein